MTKLDLVALLIRFTTLQLSHSNPTDVISGWQNEESLGNGFSKGNVKWLAFACIT